MVPQLVRLQLLLRREWRTPEGVAAVEKALPALDMQPTAHGAATVSGVMDAGVFEKRFGAVSGIVPFKTDTLETPQPLREYVESISVASQHVYLKKPAKRPKV